MKITCTTTFLDGRDRFEAGDTRTVDDGRGAYFVANGWATQAGDEAPQAGDALSVHNSTLGQEVRHG